MVSLVNSAKRVRKKHASHAQGLSQRVQDGRELPPRATSAPTGEGRPAVRTTSSPGLGGAARLHPARCTRSCGDVGGTVRGPGGRRRPRTHLLHQQADVVALDGAAVQGGAGAHALHHCNRPGRGEGVRPPVRGGCALPPAPSGPLPEKWW